MADWLTFPVELSGPCRLCRVRRINHADDEMGHEWHRAYPVPMTDRESNAAMMLRTRDSRGDYAAPLPLPAERRRIREAAGWTQKEVADELRITPQYVSMFEKPVTGKFGSRVGGREPATNLRVDYSELLKSLQSLTPQ